MRFCSTHKLLLKAKLRQFISPPTGFSCFSHQLALIIMSILSDKSFDYLRLEKGQAYQTRVNEVQCINFLSFCKSELLTCRRLQN